MVPFSTRGDDGSTSLLSGERVRKSGARHDAIGSIDEANSALGFAKTLCRHALTVGTLEWLQHEMFAVGAEAAATPERASELKTRISSQDVAELSSRLSEAESLVEIGDAFVVPGANPGSAALDVARTAVRRAERRLVGLYDAGEMRNEQILAFVNRASDLMFVLARLEAEEQPAKKV
jgi:cob(I)alamin adenosyltransferase